MTNHEESNEFISTNLTVDEKQFIDEIRFKPGVTAKPKSLGVPA
jgi:F420-0:gamma-glutamyl ligase-like protein